jgi:hypothetical protein
MSLLRFAARFAIIAYSAAAAASLRVFIRRAIPSKFIACHVGNELRADGGSRNAPKVDSPSRQFLGQLRNNLE